MTKPLLHNLFNWIPNEDKVLSKFPGLSLEEYWSNNGKFICGYDDKGTIVLIYRCFYTKKRTKIEYHGFKWYGYIKRSDIKKIPPNKMAELKENLNIKIQIAKGGYFKVFVENKSVNLHYELKKEFPELDDKCKLVEEFNDLDIEFLESDLSNCKLFCIENDIQIDDNFKSIKFDIETDDRKGGIVVGRDRILSFAAVNQNGKSHYHVLDDDTDESEAKLLKQIEKTIKSYDIIVGWNSTTFDLPYIKERYKYHFDYNMSMKGVAHIDFMKRFQRVYDYDKKIRSWSLNFISKYFLKDQKIDIGGAGGGRIYNLWKNDRKKLKEYNLKDCQLLYQLEKKLSVLFFIIKACQWTGTFPNKFYISELLDNYILRYANKRNIHFKATSFNKVKQEFESDKDAFVKEKKKVVGGFVMEPIKGLHENVCVFDFKSLYPSIIMSFNISPETLKKRKPKIEPENYIRTVNGFWTSKNKMGILPSIEFKFSEEREEYKKIEVKCVEGTIEYKNANSTQLMVKELANSMYGITAQQGSRYYDKDLAESITKGGHYLFKLTEKSMLQKFGYKTIYGDTDSNFVIVDDSKNLVNVSKNLNELYGVHLKDNFNTDKSYITLEYEKKFKTLLLLQKKNYVGWLTDKDGRQVDEMFCRGLEYVKRETVEYGRRLQIDLATRLLKQNLTLSDSVKFIQKEMNKFTKGVDVKPEDLTLTTRISQAIDKYKNKGVHVHVAEQMIEDEKEFYVGMFIPYIIVGREKKLKGIHADDYDGVYDKEYYWDSRIYALLYRLLTCVYPDYDWDQFLIKIVNRRIKHFDKLKIAFSKCKTVKQKQKVIDRINKNKFITIKQKDILLGNQGFSSNKRRRFKLKVSKSENVILEKIKVKKIRKFKIKQEKIIKCKCSY